MSKERKQETLIIVDCFALIHRAYHAFPDTLLTSSGELVNATYGFTALLLEVVEKFNPEHLICVFDPGGGNFRNQMFADYKANRGPAEPKLINQLSRIREVIAAFNTPLLEVKGFEADDVIGTLVTKYEASEARRTIIVTGDRDLFQLVDEQTSVYLAGGSFSQSKLFGPNEVVEKMGVRPDQIIEIKGLEGDQSDNIPGVAGIGKAGAVSLIQQFETIDNIYKSIDSAPNRYKQKLIDGYEQAILSRQLATIELEVPLVFDFSAAKFGGFDYSSLRELFIELEFKSLLTRIEKLSKFYQPDSVEQLQLLNQYDDLPIQDWVDDVKLTEESFLYLKVDGLDGPRKELTTALLMVDEKIFQLDKDQLRNLIAKFSNKNCFTNDAKSLYQLFPEFIDAKLQIWDLPIMGNVISGGIFKADFAELITKFSGGTLSEMPDGAVLPLIKDIAKSQMDKCSKDKNLLPVVKLEMEVVAQVARMELNGLGLDTVYLEKFAKQIQDEIIKVEKAIYTEVGHEFNISSPKQVGEVLFGERGLPHGKKNKNGGYSTNERILLDLVGVDPLINMILKYREITKLLSTYIQPLPTYVNPTSHRLHGNFNQVGAVTGRFSSDRPNLQNLPIRDELGQQLRKSIIPTQGSVLFAFDYSQQELRILAELAQEPTLIETFRKGEDIHSMTAAAIFGIELDKVTKDQRRVGKTINFGIVYGISAFGLADRLKISPKESAEFIDKYFQTYPKIKTYFEKLLSGAQREGYAATIMGRRRSAVGLSAGNFQLREAVRREIMNFPLQGSAADFMKVALIKVPKVISQINAKLVLQIHDELLIEVPFSGSLSDLEKDKSIQSWVKDMKEIMSSVADLSVNLEVEAKFGVNWLEMQSI